MPEKLFLISLANGQAITANAYDPNRLAVALQDPLDVLQYWKWDGRFIVSKKHNTVFDNIGLQDKAGEHVGLYMKKSNGTENQELTRISYYGAIIAPEETTVGTYLQADCNKRSGLVMTVNDKSELVLGAKTENGSNQIFYFIPAPDYVSMTVLNSTKTEATIYKATGTRAYASQKVPAGQSVTFETVPGTAYFAKDALGNLLDPAKFIADKPQKTVTLNPSEIRGRLYIIEGAIGEWFVRLIASVDDEGTVLITQGEWYIDENRGLAIGAGKWDANGDLKLTIQAPDEYATIESFSGRVVDGKWNGEWAFLNPTKVVKDTFKDWKVTKLW